ncbi:MAG: radical SAM protein [Magnetococcales bacterium]|nr:radical SAM protein [Magnetococcales bacterium]
MNFSSGFSLARHILRANLGWNPKPYKLTWAVTWRCNSRCRACRIWQTNPGAELAPEELQRLLRHADDLAWIDLTGGEPFLRPDLAELTAVILERFPHLYHLHLPSNGVAPDLVIRGIEAILAQKPNFLTITLSLDGPPERHDALRGVAGNWRDTLAIYRHFAAHPRPNLRLFFGFTLSAFNAGMLADAMRAVQEALPGTDHRQWHLNLAHHSHYYQNTGVVLRDPASEALMPGDLDRLRLAKRRDWFDPVALLERLYLARAKAFLRTRATPLPCQALRASLFMTPDGTCHPCSIWEFSLGNVREFGYDLRALLEGARAREARERIRAGDCPQCWTPCDAIPTILGHILHPWAFFR